MKKVVLIIMSLLISTATFAYDIEVANADGKTIYYNYTNDGKELEVTYLGSDPARSPDRYTGRVVIPEEVTYMNRTRKVTSIGNKAFSGCSGLTSITIPSSVTSIGARAFYSCSKLTTITISNGVTSIESQAFEYCSSLTSITIPSSVTSIGRGAFDGCSGIKKVIVSDMAAWYGIIFADGGANPLCYAKHLYSDENTEITDLVIPNSVTSIGNYAFYGCSGLTSITIPNSVTSIGNYAFYGCSGLTSITIPNSVTGIGILSFAFCSGLTTITIPNSVTSIESRVFLNCSSLTSITIPNSVTSIGANAFDGCSSLTSITIPNSVTSIGWHAFYCCSSLTSITIPNSMTSIGHETFYGCSGLTTITIPNSVTSIGDKAFDGANIITVISMIEKPFAIKGKASSNYRTFSLNTFNNATLYVPAGTIDKYKATEGWKDFFFIEERAGEGGDPPMPKYCAKPIISYSNGQLKFDCETEGVQFISDITDRDIKKHFDAEIPLSATYNISVYATKEGYENSDVATATLCWIDAEPMQEGTIEAEDAVVEVKAIPVLVQTDGSTISIQGAAEGTEISAYDINGTKLSSTIANKGTTTFNTQLPSGSTAIVKIGEKAVKVLVR